MSDRIEWFTVTIPASTAKTAPVTVPCVFQQGMVSEIDVIVPPGPAGNVGYFIAAGGSQYIPRTQGSFIVVDDKYLDWAVSNAPTSGSWAVTAYNTDITQHTLQVGFHVDETGAALTTSGQIIGASSAALSIAMSQAGATQQVAAGGAEVATPADTSQAGATQLATIGGAAA